MEHSEQAFVEEKYIKEKMAERLNALFHADPLLVNILLRSIYLTDFKTAMTHVECNQLTGSNISTDFLGIINSLFGENTCGIRPVYSEGSLMGFKVDTLDSTELINVNKDQYLIKENK